MLKHTGIRTRHTTVENREQSEKRRRLEGGLAAAHNDEEEGEQLATSQPQESKVIEREDETGSSEEWGENVEEEDGDTLAKVPAPTADTKSPPAPPEVELELLAGRTFEELKSAVASSDDLYLVLQVVRDNDSIASRLVNLPAAVKCGSLTKNIWRFLCNSNGESDIEEDNDTPCYHQGVGWIKDIVLGNEYRASFVESMEGGDLLGRRVLKMHTHKNYE
jgi:hypothetical protein